MGECVQCLCTRERVRVCQCNHWGSRLCVYMAEVPMTNVVRTSSRLGNVHKKDARSTTPLLFFLYKHVLSISTLCAFFSLQFYNVIRKQCSLFCTSLPIFVPAEEVLICGVIRWGPAFLLSVRVLSLLLYFRLLLLALLQPW